MLLMRQHLLKIDKSKKVSGKGGKPRQSSSRAWSAVVSFNKSEYIVNPEC